ncbi:MAG: AMP-binding protein [Enterocloster bolteae]
MAILRSEELKNNRDEFIQNTFCKIFHRTALRYPDKTAVSDENCSLTYRELDEYSNFLAKHLVSLGVRREEIVAIQSGRHVKTVIGILAVWKAGAAYVFLDDCYPESRNHKIQEECGYRIILTDEYFSNLHMEPDNEYTRPLPQGGPSHSGVYLWLHVHA